MEPSQVNLKRINLVRRIIYLLVAIAVVLPCIVKIPLPGAPNRWARKVYDQVEELRPTPAKPHTHMLLAFDYDPSSMAELYPMSKAVLRHCFRIGAIPVAVSHWLTSLPLIRSAFESTAAENLETCRGFLETVKFPCNKADLTTKIQDLQKAQEQAEETQEQEQEPENWPQKLTDFSQERDWLKRMAEQRDPLIGKFTGDNGLLSEKDRDRALNALALELRQKKQAQPPTSSPESAEGAASQPEGTPTRKFSPAELEGLLCILNQIDDRKYAGVKDVLGQHIFTLIPKTPPKNGKDYAMLGFRPGGVMLILNMGENFKGAFGADMDGQPTAVMPALDGVASLRDFDLAMDFAAGGTIEGWIAYGADRFGFPLVAGSTAVQSPDLYTWLPSGTLDPGQLKGFLGGLRGAADYEVLLDTPDQATSNMPSQSAAHVLIIALIVLANIQMLLAKRSARRQRNG